MDKQHGALLYNPCRSGAARTVVSGIDALCRFKYRSFCVASAPRFFSGKWTDDVLSSLMRHLSLLPCDLGRRDLIPVGVERSCMTPPIIWTM